MPQLTSHEALKLTAHFAFTADRMRSDESLQKRASFYETASRVAFLRAHSIAKREQVFPALGQPYRRAMFAAA